MKDVIPFNQFDRHQKPRSAFALGLCFLVGIVSAVHAETVYFLLSERRAPQVESYVLPLRKPEHIAEARRQLAGIEQAYRQFAAARIAKGADGINRNYLAPGAPPWSWHVTEFIGFYDGISHGRRDGEPSDVEQYFDIWDGPAPERNHWT